MEFKIGELVKFEVPPFEEVAEILSIDEYNQRVWVKVPQNIARYVRAKPGLSWVDKIFVFKYKIEDVYAKNAIQKLIKYYDSMDSIIDSFIKTLNSNDYVSNLSETDKLASILELRDMKAALYNLQKLVEN